MNIKIDTNTKQVTILQPVKIKELKKFLKDVAVLDWDEYEIVSDLQTNWLNTAPYTIPCINPYPIITYQDHTQPIITPTITTPKPSTEPWIITCGTNSQNNTGGVTSGYCQTDKVKSDDASYTLTHN